MKKEKRWVYWCEFCKKSGRSASAMTRHEMVCTLNPNRTCRMCKHTDESQRPIAELIVLAMCQQGKPEDIVATVYDASNNCPACKGAGVIKVKE